MLVQMYPTADRIRATDFFIRFDGQFTLYDLRSFIEIIYIHTVGNLNISLCTDR